MPQKDLYERILETAKRKGFFWPSFELYGAVGGLYTFGNLGTRLMRRIEEQWRNLFVLQQGFQEISSPVITPSRVFEASGHIAHFKEYLVECSSCGRRYRADELIEEETGAECPDGLSSDQISEILEKHGVSCPECGGAFSSPIEFNTMFKTSIGATGKETGYGRPEAAQGMFLDFKQGYEHARNKLPFAMAQIGKVLRNEISPRKGMIRLREFTIMELELFFDPGDRVRPDLPSFGRERVRILSEEMQRSGVKDPVEIGLADALETGLILTPWQAYFMGLAKTFIGQLGVPTDRQRFKALVPEERAHYSAQTFDQEVLLNRWGWVEVSGHAYRTDYDLKAHAEGSGVDMSVLTEGGKRIVPHVVEPSFGLERLTYVTMEYSVREEQKRTILSFPRCLSPTHIAVLPLVTRDGLPEKAQSLHRLLVQEGFITDYDESGSIGRRYARADEAGTLLGLTVDYDTLEDNTVTLRDRDTWKQVRQEADLIPHLLREYIRGKIEFNQLGVELKPREDRAS